MAAEITRRLRQFVVRLEQPGLYDELAELSHHRSKLSTSRVAMTDIAREAIAAHVAKERKKYGL